MVVALQIKVIRTDTVELNSDNVKINAEPQGAKAARDHSIKFTDGHGVQ